MAALLFRLELKFSRYRPNCKMYQRIVSLVPLNSDLLIQIYKCVNLKRINSKEKKNFVEETTFYFIIKRLFQFELKFCQNHLNCATHLGVISLVQLHSE